MQRLFTWMGLALVMAIVGCGGKGDAATGAAASASAAAAPAANPSRAKASSTLNTAALPAGVAPTALVAGAPLKVGVTLHPYYSWTKNVVGDALNVEVRAILPGDIDAGDYQPRPDDIAKIGGLNALVVNGIGHDDFIGDMIRSSGNANLVIVRTNAATPTVKSAHGDAPNSHTFLSFTNAVQQSYLIAKTLGQIRPDVADVFQKNAEAYATRLRAIKARGAEQLAHAKVKRVVTVHDGYAYLCQEFGLEVAGVVQPAHGLVPSAAELAAMTDLLKREHIQVVLTEESFPAKLLDVLKKEVPVRVYVVSHVASGAFTADKFEVDMKQNVDTLVKALVTDG
jgi:zinc transport system substrate-binding protein